MTTIRIGINPITWTNDDVPELGGDTPLEVCLSETGQAGYAGTELGGKFPRQSSVLRPIVQAHGLEIVSGWYDGRIAENEVEAEFDAILPHLTLLKEMGSKVVVYADTSYGRHGAIHDPASIRPELPNGDWASYGKKVTRLAEKMADFGVRMGYHHHMGTVVQTDQEVDQLMQHTGEAVGLLFDSGHCMYAGGNPYALVRRHVKRINHVHLKDVRPAELERALKEDLSFMAAVMNGIFTVTGDGSVDYADILKVLADNGYSGWLVVEAEQDPAKANPLKYATLGYQNTRKLAEAAGFTVIE
ncbi:myo-inosose-2 dehydratase [Paraburkholderia sp. BL10I2N1]|uniref:myo-inosose-2 dehydratase n=1 Tax=Paraburkholderia sp. BL10I2N1 TaxID=1938796 RepID=UPI00105C0C9F|nr:myo-inosose-2 dehydratase [Paraburkholderia sp. BL10I2N1]TDN63165.1 2-keto-myo-inositol dehydratase [Paraburkholderia sp. BL10I2N1]